jgi:hypothetical protein
MSNTYNLVVVLFKKESVCIIIANTNIESFIFHRGQMIQMLFSLSLLLFTVACSSNGSSTEIVKDLNTDQKPQKRITELGKNIISFSVPDDTMERDGEFPEIVVIDLNAGTETISRGDIIYVEFPKDTKSDDGK